MDFKAFAQKVFDENPSRFTKKEKAAMQRQVREEMLAAGWQDSEITVQRFKGLAGSENIIIGDINAEYLITGHYDTPASNGWTISASKLVGQTAANILFTVLFPVICIGLGMLTASAGVWVIDNTDITEKIPALEPLLITLPTLLILAVFLVGFFCIKNRNNRNDNTSGTLCVLDCAARAAADEQLRSKCCFVLFDNEEIGLVGSAQLASWCKKKKISLKNKTVINLDCVGVGEKLCAARTGIRNKKQAELIERLRRAGLDPVEKRSIIVYMSDHANFRNSYMLCYTRKSKLGFLYIPNIHTQRDVECDLDMVDGLAEKIMAAVRD